MLIYYNIALTYKPRVWLSSQFVNGLFPKLNKIKFHGTLSDIMGNKIINGLIPENPEEDSIYVENID